MSKGIHITIFCLGWWINKLKAIFNAELRKECAEGRRVRIYTIELCGSRRLMDLYFLDEVVNTAYWQPYTQQSELRWWQLLS